MNIKGYDQATRTKDMASGTPAPNERAHYSDIDMKVERDAKGIHNTRKNNEPY
jgi:hypothetical protein